MKLATLSLVVQKSLRRHLLSTTITVLSAALASGLVMAVFSVSAQARRAFAGGDFGFDAVLGARGSALQLVLNSVFHLETSPGSIPWSLYEDVLRDDRAVALAVPFALGDSYRGFRVVGTTGELFSATTSSDGEPIFRTRAGGRAFEAEYREALVGSFVARKLGIAVGDTLHPAHGVFDEHGEEHEEEYVVVGVLEPTNTPSDRVIWVPIEGVYRMSGHVLRGTGTDYEAEDGQAIPDEHREVSAVMLRFRSSQAGFAYNQRFNRQDGEATLAWPISTSVAQLFDRLGWVSRVLELVAYLVVVVAAGSILASLYNTMNERRREFCILRALGARRGFVFAAIVGEATAIAALGCALGYFVYFAILNVAAAIVRRETGVVLDAGAFHVALVATPFGMLALGAVAGLLPARKAYSTDVASGLAASDG